MDQEVITTLCMGAVVIGLFIGGIAATISGIRNRRKGTASQNWPAAGGVITKAWIVESRDTDEDGYTSTTYKPKWEYQYQIGQQTFTSSRISFGGETSYGRRKKAQEKLDQFPVNSKLRVYYAPSNPGESVLIRGTKGTMGGIIVGIVMILLSIFGMCGGLYQLFITYLQ